MSESKPQFANFREAFCAYYRVSPEKYSRAVLWRSLPVSRRPLAAPILAFNRTFFATDLDIIRSLGAMTSEEQFSLQLDELYAVNRLERNIRRGFLGIRASGTRLMSLWKTVAPYVAPTAVVPSGRADEVRGGATPAGDRRSPDGAVVPEYIRTSPAIMRRVGRPSGPATREGEESRADVGWGAGDAIEGSAVVLRRLKRACDDISLGLSPAEAVTKAGLDDVQQLERLLAVNAAKNPSFGWMLGHLRLAEQLRQAEAELARHKLLVTEQAVELARWRGSGPRP